MDEPASEPHLRDSGDNHRGHDNKLDTAGRIQMGLET
jgi:hypothetical protein